VVGAVRQCPQPLGQLRFDEAIGPVAGLKADVEVVPRVSVQAGFELATGILVNTVPPEQAAEMLRGARVP
jgi:galactose-1-phosphate uridylyltransferase